ncbi:MAG: hypothetical protein M1822_002786 [Bathelium mastoideum]|nr:MAG: hypothetical protein M1822_002786 [Bathelium mastoideum]
MSPTANASVAVLYQAIDPPLIGGVRKLKKPGGYQDSGADIAFVLRNHCNLNVITPDSSPVPSEDTGWCFPDTEDGIRDAIERGATHLWANTILFASHPLQASAYLDKYESRVRVVGQPPLLVEKFDDKDFVNNQIRKYGSVTMPRCWTVSLHTDPRPFLQAQNLPFPIVGKPIRGRGSQGVKVCYSFEELYDHLQSLSQHSPTVMLEEFLSGEEATVTVMPPGLDIPRYWAMPVVVRFNHDNGIAPYNGVVAVTTNSQVISQQDMQNDSRYEEASRQCEEVAKLMQATAPVRIDIRRFNQDPGASFALFDINMKPNMTGPGRPGRENQASLTAMSAAGLGWTYPMLLQKLLMTAQPLGVLRKKKPEL